VAPAVLAVLEAWVVWVVWVVSGVWAVPAVPVASAGQVVLAGQVVSAALVVLVVWVAQATVRRKCLPAAITGSTTRNTVVAPRIAIVLQRTGLAARLAEIHSPIVRLAPGSRLADRAEIWPAIAAAV
jgi:hypothetical protein